MIFVTPQSNAAITTFAQEACGYAGEMRDSMTGFGFTSAGEWSLAVNGTPRDAESSANISDCGQYLNGVGQGARYDGTFPGVTTVTGSCADWIDATKWSAAKKAQFATLAGAWIDATQVRSSSRRLF